MTKKAQVWKLAGSHQLWDFSSADGLQTMVAGYEGPADLITLHSAFDSLYTSPSTDANHLVHRILVPHDFSFAVV